MKPHLTLKLNCPASIEIAADLSIGMWMAGINCFATTASEDDNSLLILSGDDSANDVAKAVNWLYDHSWEAGN